MTCQRHEEIVENTWVWHWLRGRKAVDHGTRHIEGIKVVLYISEEDVLETSVAYLLICTDLGYRHADASEEQGLDATRACSDRTVDSRKGCCAHHEH
jgi:hypothetical protein